MAGVNDGIFKTWCKNDFSTISLQRPDPVYTHSHTNRLTHSVPVTRGETSALARSSASWQPAPAKPAVQSVPIAPARITTDNISHWTAPSTVTSHGPELHKFNVLSRSEPWTPHPSNVPGARRAVYDPIAHKTTVFTFDGKDGISRVEGKGDHLLRAEQQRTLNESAGAKWNGRRKGVVEFRDRTHCFAVNKNERYLQGMREDPKSYARVTGEMTNWFDRGFESRVKLPFYNKTPMELGK